MNVVKNPQQEGWQIVREEDSLREIIRAWYFYCEEGTPEQEEAPAKPHALQQTFQPLLKARTGLCGLKDAWRGDYHKLNQPEIRFDPEGVLKKASLYAESDRGGSHFLQIVVDKDDELEQIFMGLARNWKEATRSFSLNMRRYAHPTYQILMHTLGKEDVKDVVPLILRELQQRPDVWFEALKVLTKENPAIEAETFDEAVNAWLEWGKRKQYVT